MSPSEEVRAILDALEAVKRNDAERAEEIRRANEAFLLRLDRIEAALQGELGASSRPGIISRVDAQDTRIAKLEDENQWTRRTLIGAIAGGTVSMVVTILATLMSST